jgi:hypothetical protein
MARKFFSFVFAFLLLGLQQELLLHPLTHLPELKARHHSSLKLPAIDIACVECSLLAERNARGSRLTVASGLQRRRGGSLAFEPAARCVAAPSYYRSRAPPLSL